MRPTVTSVLALRPLVSASSPAASTSCSTWPSSSTACAVARLMSRSYATQNSLGTTPTPQPRRRTITPFNDDGRVAWKDLSSGEKASRATQQTFNFGMIVVGLVLTGGVTYFLWTDVFSPDSKIAHFNRAVDKIRADPRLRELLGSSRKITAHGDETFNKWRRARPVASTERVDPDGTQHLMMHFFVEGPLDNGVARLHMVKRPNWGEYEYKYLFVDVKGHERVYLEKDDDAARGGGRKQLSFFGIKW
ncbi:mitochondrial import inner membrane translocase subunit TIM21 [Geosmithia morbida]|uniref:Mitochondrial import inner membrane translocase subunit Tim21 n=1 Tax=Geosmithia morbida TaxID=1094350 RepID=A0A9P5D506_9HYPO|nr:mitochondrial import inner membrane translocase subunit TIM21 [Geosmithia morbida]KAF4126677.1 mitochondrial import inner membrane translocase subunit TIM21 [Geosmithia morbida]